MSETKLGVGTEQTLADVHDPAKGDTLISSASSSSSRRSAPAVGSGKAAEGEPSRGDSIGRFVVLGVLGSGGMGLVYSAYDPHLDRKVAIKLLRADAARTPGYDARTRLLREAQAMAKINHPNVIKVHEVGMFGDQVYVAMEFADAGTIRGWLKNGRHAPRAILDVFVHAGRGLAAAHAAGLVHRDFKPDNVLMASDGSVRVTDFGLVSVLAEADPNATLPDQPPAGVVEISQSTPLSQDLTRTGSIMGTPTYMAPEQFSGASATARTDQFAFCVALYEALYDERPFAGVTYPELAANVLEGVISPAPKASHVPGWLRRVLLRGLATDPAARFPSMVELLSALTRDPARRRRNVIVVGGATTCLAAVAAVLALRPSHGAECRAGDDRIAAIWNPDRRTAMQTAFVASGRPHAGGSVEKVTQLLDGWSRSWRAGYVDACEATRVRGDQSEHLLDLRMQCLTRRLDDARATIDLMVAGGGDAVDHAVAAAMALPSITSCADPSALLAVVAPPEREITRIQVSAIRGRLDQARGLRRLARYAAGLAVAKPALAVARAAGYAPVTAEALVVVGQLQVDLADKASVDTLREAMHVAAAAGDTPTLLDAAGTLVFALTTQTSQLELAQEVAGLAEAIASHAAPPVEVAVRLDDAIALLESTRGHSAAAEARYEATLAFAEKQLGPDHLAVLTTQNQLATVLQTRGRNDDAIKLYERVLAVRERVAGKDHPDVASALNNLGNAYRRASKLDDAKRLYDRALAIRLAALGPDHPDVGTSYNNLGTLYGEQGDAVSAQKAYEKALEIWEKAYGPDSFELVAAVGNLGDAFLARGDYDHARIQFDRALALTEAAQGKDSAGTINVLTNLGVLEQEQGKLAAALELFQRVERIATKAYGPDHPDVADVLANEATVLKQQHKLDEAQAMLTRALAVSEKAYGPDHPRIAMSLINLGNLQHERKDDVAAQASYRKSIAIFEAKLGKNHPYLSYPLLGLGTILADQKHTADALPMLERAVALRAAAAMPPKLVAEARYELAIALADAGQRARALTEAKTALAEYLEAKDAPDDVADIRAWIAKH